MDADLGRRVTDLEQIVTGQRATIDKLVRAVTNLCAQVDEDIDPRLRAVEGAEREREDTDGAHEYLSQLDPTDLPRA